MPGAHVRGCDSRSQPDGDRDDDATVPAGGETWGQLRRGNPLWLAAGGALELLSIAGYTTLFRTVFGRGLPRIDWRVVRYSVYLGAVIVCGLGLWAGVFGGGGSVAITRALGGVLRVHERRFGLLGAVAYWGFRHCWTRRTREQRRSRRAGAPRDLFLAPDPAWHRRVSRAALDCPQMAGGRRQADQLTTAPRGATGPRGTMLLGLIFALVCALGTNLSSLFKARGAVLARPIRVRHPLRSATDLFRQRWFAVGWILALFAWGLHIEALALAPLSSVQAVLSGGLVFLAVLAERFFGFHLGRRQWAGVSITTAGLAVIGLTATSEGPQRSSLAALIVAETAILAIGVGLVRISTRRDVEHRSEALLLATAAGVLFGVSDVAIKYLTHAHGPVFGLISPWTITALISFVVSFYASARSLQIGLAIEVIATTSIPANLSAILGGVLVFGEPIGSGPVGIIGRLLAFGLVIAGAALVPAPLRAT